jgi:hypothetical protein
LLGVTPIDSRFIAGIRPEAFSPAEGRSSEAEGAFEAATEVVEPTGADMLAVFRLGGRGDRPLPAGRDLSGSRVG